MTTKTTRTIEPPPSPARAIVEEVRNIYEMLNNKEDTHGTVSRYYTPTIRFTHMPSTSTESESYFENDDGNTVGAKQNIFDIVASRHDYSKAVAVYLPGMDGSGISAHWQFPDLCRHFEFWRMAVDTEDRSTFSELVTGVIQFIDEVAHDPNGEKRDVVLIGESFGGLLAPAVALRRKDVLKGMVLVNPATSFDSSQWTSFGPLLTTLRHLEERKEGHDDNHVNTVTPYSVLGGLTLAASIPDSNQFGRIVERLIGIPITSQNELGEVLEAVQEGLGILLDKVPALTIEHRLRRWLPVGTAVVNPRLSSINIPTLVVAGGEDSMLPTKNEADRLKKEMPNCTSVEFDSSGHVVLDERVNLTKLILDSNIFPVVSYDPILDWKPPTRDESQEAIDRRVKPLRALTSPVFFSTDSEGRRHNGLGQIPNVDGGPLLVVANHQFAGIDLGMIIAQMIEERNIHLRGLAHPVIFQSNGEFEGGGGKGQDGDFKKFGAVMVTPRNYYRLMQTGQAAMLFPGGVREVFHGKDEAYKLFWPSDGKVDFVRVAAKFNATILPLSAIGAADSVNILIDSPDMLKLPFGLGDRVANNSRNVVSARFDTDDETELFAPPFALPKPLPARHYFMFGRAVSTSSLDHRDREACEKLYSDIQREMERGFEDMLRARDKDPFGETARRLPYELVTGKTAPTFGIEELH